MTASTEVGRSLFGKGEIINVTQNIPLLGFEGVELITDVSEIDIAMGGGFNPDKITVPGETMRKFKTAFHHLTPDLFAVLLGGTKTAGSGEKASRGEESVTLANPGTLTMTLSNTPTDDGAVTVYRLDASGNPIWFSQAVAAAEDVYSISGAVLTFAAANDTDVVYALYWYVQATGDKVTVAMDDAPSGAHLIASVMSAPYGDTMYQVTFDIPDAIPKAPASINIPRLGHDAIEVDWSINGSYDVFFEAVS